MLFHSFQSADTYENVENTYEMALNTYELLVNTYEFEKCEIFW